MRQRRFSSKVASLDAEEARLTLRIGFGWNAWGPTAVVAAAACKGVSVAVV